MATSLRFAMALLVGCVVARARSANAQSPARFGLQAGATVPVSPYSSDKHAGYHIGILVDVRGPAPLLGFRIEGAYHELKYSGNSTRAQIWMAGGDLLLKVPTPTPVTPYVIGGGGIYSTHQTLLLNAGYKPSAGVNIGGGLRFHFTGGAAFIEARYHRSSGDNGIRFVPITFGVLF